MVQVHYRPPTKEPDGPGCGDVMVEIVVVVGLGVLTAVISAGLIAFGRWTVGRMGKLLRRRVGVAPASVSGGGDPTYSEWRAARWAGEGLEVDGPVATSAPPVKEERAGIVVWPVPSPDEMFSAVYQRYFEQEFGKPNPNPDEMFSAVYDEYLNREFGLVARETDRAK